MLSSVALQPCVMEEKTLERVFLFTGGLLVLQSFVDLAPEGPWHAASFTRGVLALFGLVFSYLAWFHWTFGVFGIAPTLSRWKDPANSWSLVMVFGLACLVATKLIRNFDTSGFFPTPTGLILLFIGSLAILNAGYVWLVAVGPLKEEEE